MSGFNFNSTSNNAMPIRPNGFKTYDIRDSSLHNLSIGSHHYHFTGNGTGNISGIVPHYDGHRVILYNAKSGSDRLIINHENTSSNPENRFDFNVYNGVDVLLLPGESAEFIYNNINKRWVIISLLKDLT